MSGDVRLTPRAAETSKLAERIEQGTAYHEPVEVYFVDRQKHLVEVYAVSEREFAEACKKAGASLDVFDTGPEVSKARAEYVDACAKHGPKSPEAMKAAAILQEARRNHPMKSEQFIAAEQLILAIAEVSTHNPDITNNLLGNNDASTIAVKALELMNPPKN